jgi:hypothetical protein
MAGDILRVKGGVLTSLWRVGGLVVLTGAALAGLPGCGPGDSPRGPDVSQAQRSAELPVVTAVSISPVPAVKTVNLRAQVELAGRPGADGERLVFQWTKNGRPIEGETGANLPATAFRKGDEITVRATAGQAGRAVESPPIRITNSLPRIMSVRVTPEPATRETELRLQVQAVDADGDPLSFRYQWIRNEGEITGATGETLSLTDASKKDKIAVRVIAFDGEAEGSPYYSSPVLVQNAAPSITSTPPKAIPGGMYSYQIKAKDADGDDIVYKLTKAPAGMTIGANGLITWSVSAGVAGAHEVEVVAADPDGAKAAQAFTLTVSVAEKAP